MKSLLTCLKADRATLPLLLAIGVFVFLALPVPSSVQSHVKALGPTVAWAGSPDETLNPPPNPPHKAATIRPTISGSPVISGRSFSGRAFWYLVWRVTWLTVRR